MQATTHSHTHTHSQQVGSTASLSPSKLCGTECGLGDLATPRALHETIFHLLCDSMEPQLAIGNTVKERARKRE